jgi:hypothetical protein
MYPDPQLSDENLQRIGHRPTFLTAPSVSVPPGQARGDQQAAENARRQQWQGGRYRQNRSAGCGGEGASRRDGPSRGPR